MTHCPHGSISSCCAVCAYPPPPPAYPGTATGHAEQLATLRLEVDMLKRASMADGAVIKVLSERVAVLEAYTALWDAIHADTRKRVTALERASRKRRASPSDRRKA